MRGIGCRPRRDVPSAAQEDLGTERRDDAHAVCKPRAAGRARRPPPLHAALRRDRAQGGAGKRLRHQLTGRSLNVPMPPMYGTATDVARGVSRLLMQEGFSPILEFTLANGRRLDVAALGADGTMLGVEIKVSVADLRGDSKWPEYLEFCELFYFAIPPDFPDHHVPD